MHETVDYCRQIETYLCRKNGGHLVRIVGPAFETVRNWAAQGVPLKVAFRGIDRCCDRAQARGGRRRPMRIEFCEADVLEAFDDWRRALGVSATQVSEEAPADDFERTPRKGSLAAHIERSVTRLLAVRSDGTTPGFADEIARIVRELDGLSEGARRLRGEARDEAIERLAALDRDLIAAARAAAGEPMLAALRVEADAELEAFAARMPTDALARSRDRALERLLRERLQLPVLTFE